MLKADGHKRPRLVARGDMMSDSAIYDETFSPVVQLQTVRVVLAVAAQLNLELVMMDLQKLSSWANWTTAVLSTCTHPK